MIDKLNDVEKRYEEINDLLTKAEVIADTNRYKALMKEHKMLTPIVEKFREYKAALADNKEAADMLKDGGLDADFKAMVIDYIEKRYGMGARTAAE